MFYLIYLEQEVFNEDGTSRVDEHEEQINDLAHKVGEKQTTEFEVVAGTYNSEHVRLIKCDVVKDTKIKLRVDGDKLSKFSFRFIAKGESSTTSLDASDSLPNKDYNFVLPKDAEYFGIWYNALWSVGSGSMSMLISRGLVEKIDNLDNKSSELQNKCDTNASNIDKTFTRTNTDNKIDFGTPTRLDKLCDNNGNLITPSSATYYTNVYDVEPGSYVATMFEDITSNQRAVASIWTDGGDLIDILKIGSSQTSRNKTFVVNIYQKCKLYLTNATCKVFESLKTNLQNLNDNYTSETKSIDERLSAKIRKPAIPIVEYDSYLNIYSSATIPSDTSKTLYFDHSIIVKKCMSRGGLTAVIAYIDSDNKVIGTEHIGDENPAYNVIGDIGKYAKCAVIAVCVSKVHKYEIYNLSSKEVTIENYLADGELKSAFIDASGAITNIKTCVCSDFIKVSVGDTFVYTGAGAANKPVAFYDSNKNFVCKSGEASTDYKTQYICSPVDGYMVVYSRNYLDNTFVDGEIATLVKGDAELQEVPITWAKTGYVINNDGTEKQITDASAYYRYDRISNYLPVNYCAEYIHFYSVVSTPSTNKGVWFYDRNKTFLGAIPMARLHYSANDYWAADKVLHISDIPAGAEFMRVMGIDECADSDILNVAQFTDLDTRIFYVPKVRKFDLDLRGKKLANIGPSSSVYPSTMAWKNIVKLNTGLEITDYGVGGTGMSNKVSPTWNGQIQVDSALASGVQYDYFILWCSGNDFTQNAPIGDINSYTTRDSYSEDALETVCGGLNYCIKKIAETQPNARIICMSPVVTFTSPAYWDGQTPHPTTGKMFMDYVNAHKNVCDNKHIPWYSLRNMGVNEFNFHTYFRKDDLHFNIKGNKLLVPYVMKALKENT